MKKFTKLTLSLLLTVVLAWITSLNAMAADSTITFNGQAPGFTFAPGSEYIHTDLFDNFKNVMPGDKLTETITVTNKAGDCDYVKIYMRAEAHDEAGNPLTYDEAFEATDGKDQTGDVGERDETTVTMADFLAQLSMKVYEGERLIYDASPDEMGGLASNIHLCILQLNQTTTLTVELEVPMELGNAYANRVGEVDWVFTVESFDEPEPTLENIPEVVSPSTGDNSNISLYIGIAAACAVCGVILFVVQKKSKKQNEEQ